MTMNCRYSDENKESLFDCILDVLSDGIYISDRDGNTLKVNRAYEQLTGLTKEEMLGRKVTDLQADGKYDVILNPEIVRTGQPCTSVQTTKVGRKVILNGYPVLDENSEVALVVTFVRDVTVISQMKEQLTQQQELIDRYRSEVKYFSKKSAGNDSLVVHSSEMRRIMGVLNTIAKTDATVLLLGETGVGKDMLARKIHETSSRANQPFFKIDCTTIPENLVESELFGYEPGAFSGANAKGKPGYFEMAHKGTLFLDEIGELSLPVQAKLLRVLQDQEFMRVGSTKVKEVDVRFIAATNRDLNEAVRKGTFRSDLFYRIQVAVLHVPPLRERLEDIEPLAQSFLDRYNTKYRKKFVFTPDVYKVFRNYRWPGNIREMENFIQSLIVTREKEVVDVVDLPHSMLHTAAHLETRSLHQIMEDVEKDFLLKSWETHQSVAEIAKNFKVDRTTIFRKLKKYSII